jgi:hypothetical protein
MQLQKEAETLVGVTQRVPDAVKPIQRELEVETNYSQLRDKLLCRFRQEEIPEGVSEGALGVDADGSHKADGEIQSARCPMIRSLEPVGVHLQPHIFEEHLQATLGQQEERAIRLWERDLQERVQQFL